MRFLFVGSGLCLQLPSVSASRRTPLPLANASYYQARSGLTPPSYRPCRAHKEKAQHSIIYAVLKANAYGLGLDWMVDVLQQQGLSHFAVSDIEDALHVRELSRASEILLLNPVEAADDLLAAIRRQITITISSVRQAAIIDAFCAGLGESISAHVETDTGMGRCGIFHKDASQLIKLYRDYPNIRITGIYTHVYNAPNERHTREQIDHFSDILKMLRSAGIRPGIAHMASSLVMFRYPDSLFDAVRIGSALTGRIASRNDWGLQKVGVIETAISDIWDLSRGQNIGYGVFRVKRQTTAAVVPSGYLSGFGLEKRRDLFRLRDLCRVVLRFFKAFISRKPLYVTVNGMNAPVLGRIGMTNIIVDIGAICCRVGDKVQMESNPMLSGNLLRAEYR